MMHNRDYSLDLDVSTPRRMAGCRDFLLLPQRIANYLILEISRFNFLESMSSASVVRDLLLLIVMFK